jgi:replicative DNA helicase
MSGSRDRLVDDQLEAALIAEALHRHDRYASRGVQPTDYGSTRLQIVATAVQEAWELGNGVSVDSVALALQRASKLDFVGGYRGLAELAAGSPSVPDSDRLKELARLRTLETAAQAILASARSGNLTEALALLGDAQVDVLSASRGKTRTAVEVGQSVFEGMVDESKARRVHPGITPFADKVGLLPLGSLTVVGGDTNVSKSGFALEMLWLAAKRNVTCGLVSMEDPDEVTGSRLLSYVSGGVSSRAIQMGRLTRDDFGGLSRGIMALEGLGGRLLFEECIGGNELDVCAAMTRMAARGARIVVVDYIQEIDVSKKQQDRRNEVRWLVKRLKTHAKRLNVALVCVSQLARPKDGETGREPSKHHLKESGDVTNSAEVVLLLWREHEEDQAPVKVRVAKCKWGGLGQFWEMQRRPALGGRLCADEDLP